MTEEIDIYPVKNVLTSTNPLGIVLLGPAVSVTMTPRKARKRDQERNTRRYSRTNENTPTQALIDTQCACS